MAPTGSLMRLAACLVACMLTPAIAGAQDRHACDAPKDLTLLALPLTRTAERIALRQPLTIVAIGSSSTFGAGASSRDKSYPSQLQIDLQARFPHSKVTVVNRGVNGEEAREMLARFGVGVIDQHPDLVIWQVGTNSVLRDRDIAPTKPLVLEGVRQLKSIGIDVVLIDPQYAPKVLARPDAQQMVDLISATAKQADVDLIRRFAIMRYWYQHDHLSFDDFISPDKLHMNDWSYACLAKLIGGSISEAAERKVASAQAHPAVHAATP